MKELLPITLSIAQDPGSAQKHSDKAAGHGLSLDAELKQKIFERDNHTCRYCGFHSEKYQDVNFRDSNPSNLQAKNLVTSCIFCHQCFNLDKSTEMRSGTLIWLPEVSQAQLNHIARAIYVARISQGSIADTAREALDTIMARRQTVTERIGTDDPMILSVVMRDFLPGKYYAMRDRKLEGVRLFPLDRRIIKEGELEFNQFPQILAYWRSQTGPFGKKPPAKWHTLYSMVNEATAT
jgi:intracellular multiplication protein IcmJ